MDGCLDSGIDLNAFSPIESSFYAKYENEIPFPFLESSTSSYNTSYQFGKEIAKVNNTFSSNGNVDYTYYQPSNNHETQILNSNKSYSETNIQLLENNTPISSNFDQYPSFEMEDNIKKPKSFQKLRRRRSTNDSVNNSAILSGINEYFGGNDTNNDSINLKNKKTFFCKDCRKSFKFQTSLLRHNNKVHNCKYQCPSCNRVFSRQAYLDVHTSKPGTSCYNSTFGSFNQ